MTDFPRKEGDEFVGNMGDNMILVNGKLILKRETK